MVCNVLFNRGVGLGDERSGDRACIHEEDVELAVHDERSVESDGLAIGCRCGGRSGSLLALLTLLALGLLVGLLGSRRELGAIGSLRHFETVASEGFRALRREEHPFVVDLGRGLFARLVETRVHLVAVNVELDLEVRFGLGRGNRVAALDVLGAASENAVAANRNLLELEFTLLELFLERVLFLGGRVDSGVHPYGRHRDGLFSERIENDTFDGTGLFATGHGHGDEREGTCSKNLFLHLFFLVF